MKRISAKRAALNRAVAPVRDTLKNDVRACEYCRRQREPDLLACHEIANGTALRRICLDKRFGLLVFCREPDFRHQIDCHRIVQEWPEVKQLCLLMLVRGTDYNLAAYNRMVNERAPARITQDEVDAYVDEVDAGK